MPARRPREHVRMLRALERALTADTIVLAERTWDLHLLPIVSRTGVPPQ